MARKPLSTKIEKELQKEIKKLAIDLEKPLNDVLEEAIRDVLKKYEKKTKKWPLTEVNMDWLSRPHFLLQRGGVLFFVNRGKGPLAPSSIEGYCIPRHVFGRISWPDTIKERKRTMKIIIRVLIGISALAFVLAVIAVLTTGGIFLGIAAEALSRTCNNLALIAIALTLSFKRINQ